MEKDRSARNLIGDVLANLVACEKLPKTNLIDGWAYFNVHWYFAMLLLLYQILYRFREIYSLQTFIHICLCDSLVLVKRFHELDRSQSWRHNLKIRHCNHLSMPMINLLRPIKIQRVLCIICYHCALLNEVFLCVFSVCTWPCRLMADIKSAFSYFSDLLADSNWNIVVSMVYKDCFFLHLCDS